MLLSKCMELLRIVTGTIVPPKAYIDVSASVTCGTMKKEHKVILISALVVASVIIAAYIVYPFMDNRALQKEYAMSQLFTPPSLTEEQTEEAKAVATSDEMANTILQMLGEPELEVLGGAAERIAILRSVSEEWIVQMTVDLEDEKVISVSLNKGMIPLVINPRDLVQIAEREFPRKEFGPPLLRKVVQKGEDGEVVFLTGKGIVTIRVDLKEEKVIGLEKELVRQSLWRLGIVLAAVIAVIVGIVLYERKSRSQRIKEELEVEKKSEIEEESEVQGDPKSPL